MVGMTTTHESIRGAMAQMMLEHMAKRASQRAAGELRSKQPVRKSKVVISEATNA